MRNKVKKKRNNINEYKQYFVNFFFSSLNISKPKKCNYKEKIVFAYKEKQFLGFFRNLD